MNFLNNLSIGKRLALGFGAVIAIFLVVIGIAIQSQSRLEQAEEWNRHTNKVLAEAGALLLSMVNMETGARGYLLAGEDRFLEPWNKGIQSFGTTWSEVKRLTADNPAQQRRLDEIQSRHQEFVRVVQGMQQQRRDVTAGRMSFDAFLSEFGQGRDKAAMDGFRGLQAEFVKAEEALLEQRSRDAADLRALTLKIEIGGTLFALVLALLIGLRVTRSITQPVAEAIDLAEAVAAGDLTRRIQVQRADEIGRLLRTLEHMNESLVRVVGTVRQGSESVATASAQIAQGNQDLSARTESQASALEQTAASMEQLGSTVKQNADNARQANQLAQSASTVAVQGGEVVGQVVDTMKGISESSRKIADIISVIDGIAFQTNILALNAAVEAARAGEQGRGFAVVAGEVRTLAGRSAEAAKEIKQLITDSVGRVEQGTALVDQAGATMSEVVASIRRVTDIMGEISAASAEQSAGVSQVGEAVTQMDQATQQNAALVEEMAAAANSLRSQAQELVQAVAVFRLAEGQATTSSAAPSLAAARRPAPAPAPTPQRPKITAPRAATPAAAAPRTAAVVAPPKAAPREDEWESF